MCGHLLQSLMALDLIVDLMQVHTASIDCDFASLCCQAVSTPCQYSRSHLAEVRHLAEVEQLIHLHQIVTDYMICKYKVLE